jgi:hypothetical protein
MVHAMHNSIAKWAKVVGSLENPGEHKEHTLGKFVHRKRPVRGVSMKKKGLKKQRQVPMCRKKYQYIFHSGLDLGSLI